MAVSLKSITTTLLSATIWLLWFSKPKEEGEIRNTGFPVYRWHERNGQNDDLEIDEDLGLCPGTHCY